MTQVGNDGVGTLLRVWRTRRHLSQLDLALRAGISQRHVSFVELGRSNPSREMLLRLAIKLEVPLRERNALLLAAGYAPMYPETPLAAEEMAAVRHAMKTILSAHAPYPALAVDRCWNVVSANEPVRRILAAMVAPDLLSSRPNMMRMTLHPDGLAPHILNFDQFATHVLARLEREAFITPDHPVAALFDEVSEYVTVRCIKREVCWTGPELFVPLRLRALGRDLALLNSVATFGTARDLTVAELSVESFFPADQDTEASLRASFT